MTFDISDFANSLYLSAGLLLSRFDVIHGTLCMLPDTDLNFDLLFEQSGIRQILMGNCGQQTNQLLISNAINCLWITLPINTDLYMIGPTLIGTISKEQVVRYYFQKGLTLDKSMILSKEYEKITIVPYASLLNYYSLIHQMLLGKKADTTRLGLSRLDEEKVDIKRNEEDSYQIQKRDFTVAIEAEYFLHDCICNGDVKRLQEMFSSTENQMSKSFAMLTSLGPDELRSMKNNMIASIALSTRAAIKGGLPVEIAFPLSDMYILQMEQMTELIAIMELHGKAIIDFASRVKNNQFKMDHSKLINQVCGYIIANINNRIVLSDIAEIAGLHPDTLSKRFKRETGTLITDYIRQVKIEEAKTLLLHTDKSITEIAYLLAYSSQSRFITSFKQIVGKTPNEFRISKNK